MKISKNNVNNILITHPSLLSTEVSPQRKSIKTRSNPNDFASLFNLTLNLYCKENKNIKLSFLIINLFI